ncbi:MAG: porin [Pseudomonadales bacterium]|nr:porin [Pseudomonadales bacterium]
MNKMLLAVGTGALFLGAGVVSASDAAKVYGRADVSYQYEDYKYGANQDGNTFVLKSNASRVGVKGKKDVGSDLTAIYQLEWEVDFTDKDSKNGDGDNILKARNSFVGMTGSFGTVVAGTHDTPLKKAQGKVDIFGDLEGDIKHVIEGEVRTIMYFSTALLK